MAPEKDAAVMDGIMLWVGAVILLVVMLPVITGVISSTPLLTNTSPLNATQQTVYSTAANSYNLIAITPIVIAAVVILGVVALLGFRRG